MSVFDRFRDLAGKRMKDVSDSAARAVRKSTLRGQIGQREASLEHAYAGVGRAVFAQIEAGTPTPPGLQDQIAGIRRELAAVAVLRAEIETLDALDRPAPGTCPACGAAAPAGQRFCIRCGSALTPTDGQGPPPPASSGRCPACGADASVGQKFCARCGQLLISGTMAP